jgi:hypothetical protein
VENKKVGLLVIGLAILMSIIVLIFNFTLKEITSKSCSMGKECSMYTSITIQTAVSFVIIAIVLIIGLFLVFTKQKEKIIIKTEKEAINLIQSESGAMFQSTLMEKLGIGKVGITRLLDKLEAKQLIERKRRGMNNIVVLKN